MKAPNAVGKFHKN